MSPPPIRYFYWLGGSWLFDCRRNLGISVSRGEIPVTEALLWRGGFDSAASCVATILSIIVGVAVGMSTALRAELLGL